jgi:hypothetical protein
MKQNCKIKMSFQSHLLRSLRWELYKENTCKKEDTCVLMGNLSNLKTSHHAVCCVDAANHTSSFVTAKYKA